MHNILPNLIFKTTGNVVLKNLLALLGILNASAKYVFATLIYTAQMASMKHLVVRSLSSKHITLVLKVPFQVPVEDISTHLVASSHHHHIQINTRNTQIVPIPYRSRMELILICKCYILTYIATKFAMTALK